MAVAFFTAFLAVVTLLVLGWSQSHYRKAARNPGFCQVCDRKMHRE